MLAAELARCGVKAPVIALVLDELRSVGYLDERRLALSRAQALADRQYGDEAIATRLAAEGFEAAEIAEVLGELAPEEERARSAISAFSGTPQQRCAALGRRGFGETALEAALASLDVSDWPSLP